MPAVNSNPSIPKSRHDKALVLYGVHDLTNYATLDKWSLRMTLVDIVWGTVLSAATAVVAQWANTWFD